MTPAELLARWVALKHEGQIIKRTSEPYFRHLAAVAEMAKPATYMGYEIGLCHDLFEDTPTTRQQLLASLGSFGYTAHDAGYVTACVIELTNVFTSHAYPDLSKAERKEKEAMRLVNISPGAQTVKYCDLIYNIGWVLKYDRKKAIKYLLKKRKLLVAMNRGDKALHQKALDEIDKGLVDRGGAKD